MKAIICQNKTLWEGGQTPGQNSSFLQSWEWGEFQKSVGIAPIRIQVLEDKDVKVQIQGFSYKILPGINYFYAARVPDLEEEFFGAILDFLKDEGFTFVRIEPNKELLTTNYSLLTTKNRQPQDTLVLNLKSDNETLLSEMHSKTRYNIRLAEKKGVIVKQEKNIENFWKLNQETTGRDQFKSHDKNYYEKMLELENCFQLTAYFEDKPIASNIFINFDKTFTYLHGTSGNQFRNLMAPYLLQWRGIELAKSLACEKYDFWGVAPSKNKKQETRNKIIETSFHNYSWNVNHKWTGITRFKAGFGGIPVSYGEARDIILNSWKYSLFNFLKKLKESL